MDNDGELVHREITDSIIKSFYEAYNTLGYGHFEAVYKRALVVALKEKLVRCEVEKTYPVFYHGVNVGDYRADLVVEGKVIVEVKTSEKIEAPHARLCFSYLKASKLHVGLLLNFGPKPQFERHFLSNP